MMSSLKERVESLYKDRDGLENGRGILQVWYSEGRIRGMAYHGARKESSVPVLLRMLMKDSVGIEKVKVYNNGIQVEEPDLVLRFDLPDKPEEAAKYLGKLDEVMGGLKSKNVGVGRYQITTI